MGLAPMAVVLVALPTIYALSVGHVKMTAWTKGEFNVLSFKTDKVYFLINEILQMAYRDYRFDNPKCYLELHLSACGHLCGLYRPKGCCTCSKVADTWKCSICENR